MNEKTFIVDWDSYESVSKLANKVKCRCVQLNPNTIKKKDKEGHILDACLNIWNTDISSHYSGLSLDHTPKYYIYCHANSIWKIDPHIGGKMAFLGILGIGFKPFYVGKGTGNRSQNLTRNGYHTKLKEKFEENGEDCIAIVIKNQLTEMEALAYEDKLIDILGLKVYGGVLANLDEGYKPQERRKLYQKPYDILKFFNQRVKIPRHLPPDLL